MVALRDFDAAIIDLDGTMVDTLGDFDVALNRMLWDLDLPAVERPVVARLIGKGSENLIASVLALVRPSAPGDAAAMPGGTLFQDAWQRYQRHYLENNGRHSQLFPGVREGLELLKSRKLKLACLTNKPTSFTLPLLKAKQIDGFFDAVFGGDAFERKKPDPLPLVKTCEALGTAPQRTLMVGDSSNDAKAARGAGCPVVLVRYGYNHGEPVEQVDADGFIDALSELR